MTSNANSIQHGGKHYSVKGAVQHWDIMADYRVGYLEGNASKYGFRWPRKNGLEDILKFQHYVQKVLEKHLLEGYESGGHVPVRIWQQFCDENEVDTLSFKATLSILTWCDEGDLLTCLNTIDEIITSLSATDA